MKDIWFGYWFKNWFFAYKIGFSIVVSGVRYYFKNHQYKGKENIPSDAGIIYAVNHQNAFLDPVVIAGQTRNPLYFLTRADIFKKPLAAKILSQLYMLPIYRQRDGVNTIKMNEKTFNQCYDILSEKGSLIIFPEGNHHYKKSLRAFKKGAARIALGAAEKYNFNIPLYIVPLGIDYENHFSMNGDLLLNAGEPIKVSDYTNSFQKDPAETINKLSAVIYKELETLIINIKDLENYNSIYYLLHKIPLKDNYNSIAHKFELRKARLRNIESINENNSNKYAELIKKSNLVKDYCNEQNIKPYLFEKNKYSVFSLLFVSLLVVLMLPIHLIGLLTNYIPYKIPVWFINKKVKDKHFHGSLKYALGVVLFYIYWLIITITVAALKGWMIGLITAVLLPFIAVFNLEFWITIVKLKGRWKFYFISKTKELNEVKKEYEEIKQLIN